MSAPLPDDGLKRRARRRLIGAVALAIVAVVILPLVLEDRPPPAGPLEVRMPPAARQALPQNAVEFAPAENPVAGPAPVSSDNPKPVKAPKPVPAGPATAQSARTSPAPAPTAAVYAVQAGVFADKANAERLRTRIESLGFKPYSDSVGATTRIRVGAFASRAEAESLQAKLAAAGIAGKVVEK